MGVKVNYSWKDKGWVAIKRRVSSKAQVHVGVLGSQAQAEHDDGGLTIGEVAFLQEFGSSDGHIPARSFLRRAVVWNNRQQIKYVLAQASRAVLFQGQTHAQALMAVGQWAIGEIRKVIASNVGPENAPKTIQLKGHGLTLRDTQKMLEAISFQIVGAFGGFQGEDYGP